MEKKPDLSASGILIAEYEYIAQTVFQANEDRSRAASFYLVTFASFIAALVGAQFEFDPAQVFYVNMGFGVLFIILAVFGLLTILSLVRLRQAWFESIAALNQIKDYYIAQMGNDAFEQAFRWRMASAPARFKPGSVGFLLVLQIALLGGVSTAAAVYFFLVSWHVTQLLWITAAAFAVSFGGQVWMYKKLLD
ncbi:MAG: hypothetical protein WHV44_11840 [Anaerolineales bacterium]